MTEKTKGKSKTLNRRTPLIIGIVAVAAVIVAVAFVALSSRSSPSSLAVDYGGIPQERLPDGGFNWDRYGGIRIFRTHSIHRGVSYREC